MPKDNNDKDNSNSRGDDNKQVVEILSALREEIGENNVDFLARLDKVEEARTAEGADLKLLRGELDSIKASATEREATIVELQRRNRTRLMEDPIASRREAIELFGMIGRRVLSHKFGGEIPRRFDGEGKRLDQYLSQRAERDTLDITTTQGAYFMPTVLQLDVLDSLEQISDLVQAVDFVTGMPTKATIPVLTGRPSLQPKRTNSDGNMNVSTFGFSEMDYATDEAYIFFPVDNWLLELAPYDLGKFLLPLTRDAFAQGMATWLIDADGTSAYNGITGILNETNADYIYTLPAGATKFENIDNAHLNAAINSILKRGRTNGTFLGSGYFRSVLDEINRTGKSPILRETAGGGVTIKGKAFFEEEGMPGSEESAADTVFAGFGDLKTFSVIMAGQGMKLDSSTEFLFNRNQTCFRVMAQLDMQRKAAKTFTLIKTAAEA